MSHVKNPTKIRFHFTSTRSYFNILLLSSYFFFEVIIFLVLLVVLCFFIFVTVQVDRAASLT